MFSVFSVSLWLLLLSPESWEKSCTPGRGWIYHSQPVSQPYPDKRSLSCPCSSVKPWSGEGNEIAHIDLLIGDKNGPVGRGVRQRPGQPEAGPLQPAGGATPNLICKPATVMITKVTIKGAKQAVQMFGPAQAAVGQGGRRQRRRRRHPQGQQAENLVIVCGVFIHWEAKDDNKIYQYNYEATKLAIQRAMKGEPKIDEIWRKKDTAKHPFSPK